MSPFSPPASNSRSTKRTATAAGFPSPSQHMQQPHQPPVVATEASAIIAAAQQFATDNPGDGASHIISLLCVLLSSKLSSAGDPAQSLSSELSAHELERQRSIVIAGLPEALPNSLGVVRDAHEKNSVLSLIDQCRPPPPPMPTEKEQPPSGTQQPQPTTLFGGQQLPPLPPKRPPAPEVCIVAAYRMGQPSRDRTRLLKVVLATRAMQRTVISASRHLRNDPKYEDVYVRPSLTKEQRDAEYQLREECRRRRKAGERVQISKGQIVPAGNARRQPDNLS